ncbi:MAG: sigma 54-interacting transcriptional regulator [Acidobacteriota bacterium]
MPLRLLIEMGSRTVRRALPTGEYVLGSDPDSEVRLRHPSVSRRHARLRVEGESGRLEDLGSTNGTWVDGRRLREAKEVGPGAELRFGSLKARLEAVDDQDLEAAVRLPPLDQEERPALGDSLHPASTATLAPAQAFWTQELPALLPQLQRGSRLENVQRVGAALFRRLPALEIEIYEQIGSQRGLLFHGRRDRLESDSSLGASEQGREIGEGGWNVEALEPVEEGSSQIRSLGIRARCPQRGVARAAEGILQGALQLLQLQVANAGPQRIGARDGGSRKLPRASAPGPPELPSPPSLSPLVQDLYRHAQRIARGQLGVLIRGETGTGKEVLARYLHRASSRAEGPWITLNCAALPQDLLEAELFGIERGVATGVEARAGKFEAADGGTLFLDEIGDMAPATQAKILRVLQEKRVHRLGGNTPRPADARILAATHQDLEALIAGGDFRDDLFHRIAGWEAQLPPLRLRRSDIPNLAAHFLQRQAQSLNIRPAGISRAAVDALVAYPWPGNVRQLASEIARAAHFLDDGELLDAALLSPKITAHPKAPPESGLKGRLEAFEREEILLALERAAGSVPRAADLLSLPVSTLYRRMKSLRISPPGEGD